MLEWVEIKPRAGHARYSDSRCADHLSIGVSWFSIADYAWLGLGLRNPGDHGAGPYGSKPCLQPDTPQSLSLSQAEVRIDGTK